MKKFNIYRTLFTLVILYYASTRIFPGLIGTVYSQSNCETSISTNPEYGWEITSIEVASQILDNGDLKIQEKIVTNFDTQKHGIYRTIPLLFEPKGKGYKPENFSDLKIENVSVTQDGSPATFSNSVRGGVQCPTSWLAGEYNKEQFIKIGDADITITGNHEYVISYLVKNALRDDKGYPELYYNMVGHGWGVPIGIVKVRLSTADKIQFVTDNVFCYSGSLGSSDEKKCGTFIIDDQTIDFSAENLEPFQGTTIQVAIKPEFASQIAANTNGKVNKTVSHILAKWYYLLAFSPFIYFLYIWYTNGRDPASRGIVAPRYDAPNGLSPAQVGLVLDQSVDNVDIASIIISIAQKGYMKIIVEKGKIFGIGTDYYFEKILPTPTKAQLSTEELMIYTNIFYERGDRVSLDSLKNVFYETVNNAKANVYNWSVSNGYLKSTPGPLQGNFMLGYLLLFIFWFLVLTISSAIAILFMVASTILSLIIIFQYRFFTSKGKAMQEEILGLKMYMATAEKDRIEFHNAPQKSPELFEKLLPYAMALGVVKIWSDKFADLHMQPPTWYVSPYPMNVFNTSSFANDLTKASSSFSSTMTSVPSSSGSSGGGGGGFSGGGGGGGSGGSW